MARKAREKSSTGIYAVLLRGNMDIFKKEDMRQIFLDCCEKYLGKGLLAVKISKDKAEMLIKESEKGISLDMKPLITSFARTYNRESGNDGKVFADRFKSMPVEDDDVMKDTEAYLNGEKSSAEIFKPKRAAAAGKTAAGSKVKAQKKPEHEKAENKEQAEKQAAEKIIKAENTADTENERKNEAEKPVQKQKQRSLPTWLL